MKSTTTKRLFIIGDKKQKERFKSEFKKNFYLGYSYNENSYDTVIIISKDMKIDKLNSLIYKYRDISGGVYIVPYITDINFAYSTIMEYSNIQLNSIFIENRLLIKKNIIIKNIFDKILAISIMPFYILIYFK